MNLLFNILYMYYILCIHIMLYIIYAFIAQVYLVGMGVVMHRQKTGRRAISCLIHVLYGLDANGLLGSRVKELSR